MPCFASVILRGAQLLYETVVEVQQTFDDDLSLSQDRHEIRISVPPGHDVPVKMPWQTGTGCLALVEADVVALRLQHPVEDGEHPLYRFDWLDQIRSGQFAERSTVQTWSDEEMSIIIGITVQNDERPRAPFDDQVLAILVTRQSAAQKALLIRLGRGGRRLHVMCSPRSPDPI